MARIIDEFPRYSITRFGDIFRVSLGSKLSPAVASGYLAVWLYKGGKRHKKYVHDLVITTFNRPRRPGEVCRHLDGNKLNNHYRNLIWGTPVENSHDMIAQGTRIIGEKHPQAKLAMNQVLSIRNLRMKGKSLKFLSEIFNIHPSTVSRISNFKLWKHVTEVRL